MEIKVNKKGDISNLKQISKALKTQREALKISQMEASKRADVSYTTYWNFEQQNRIPTNLFTLLGILKGLGFNNVNILIA